jgi:hypothetical protein
VPDTADDLTPAERDVASELDRRRPIPAAEFRGALGRHLAVQDPGYGPRPPHLHMTVLLYLAAGAIVLLIGVLQALGAL